MQPGEQSHGRNDSAPRSEPGGHAPPTNELGRGAWHGVPKRLAIILLLAAPYVAASASDQTVCAAAGLFGVPCPGCGLTRATLAALHGDLAGAFRLHPLFAVVAPTYVYLLVGVAYRYVAGPLARPPSRLENRIVNLLAGLLVVLLLAVWVSRFLGAFGGPVPVRTWWAGHGLTG